MEKITNVNLTPISPYEINITWLNGDRYQYIEVWVNEAGGGYGSEPWHIIPGSNENFFLGSLTPETNYCIELVGCVWEPPECADPSTEQCDDTHAELQAPSDLVALGKDAIGTILPIPVAGCIELTWKDNSASETGFEIQRRKTSGGAYVTIFTTAKNVQFYRDTGLDPDEEYIYQIRADNGTPSAWTGDDANATATTLAAVSASSTLVVVSGSKTNKVLRLQWDAVSGATGYKIEQSDSGVWGGEEEEIIVIPFPITDFLVRNLLANTEYWFRIRAYNAVGNSGYTNLTGSSVTTLASYTDSVFEQKMSDPIQKPIYLVEINPKKTLTGFTLVATKTYTYEYEITDRGIDFENVYEDGVAYDEESTVNAVEGNPGSFYCDYSGRVLYVHAFSGDDPDGFLIEGSFWLYFSNQRNIVFNNNKYLNLISSRDIPSVVREIKPYFEGTYRTSTGSIELNNVIIEDGYYFDKISKTFTWDEAQILLKMGFPGFAYSNFVGIVGGLCDTKAMSDKTFMLSFRDTRHNFDRELELNTYTTADFPGMVLEREDKSIPRCYGVAHEVLAAAININAVLEAYHFKFHDGRIKSVEKVDLDGDDSLVEDTDYYVDYQRGIITMDSTKDVDVTSIVKISFIGIVDSADDPIMNGAEVFCHIMVNEYGLVYSELELDSIYETKKETEDFNIAIYLNQNEKYEDIMRKLEHTLTAFTYPDGDGKLGLKYFQSAAAYDVRYIKNHQIFEFEEQSEPRNRYYKVIVYYREIPHLQEWKSKEAEDLDIRQEKSTEKDIKIYTYLYDSVTAQELADKILLFANTDYILFNVSTLLYDRFPGEIIKVSRDRAYNAAGVADEDDMRILRMELLPSDRHTQIVGEWV